MKRFAIWDKQTPIITASGAVYSPDAWIELHPSFGLDNITAICAAGEINGAHYFTLGQLVDNYSRQGCDFSACKTDEDKLNAIEAFLDARDVAEAEAVEEAKANEALQADALASIAASLEYQNLMTLPDVEE